MVSMVSVRVRTSQLEWTSSHRCTSSRWGLSHFGDELRTHHLSLPRVFLALFFIPNFSPPTSFPAYFITIAQESSRAWVALSFKEMQDTRLEEGGELHIEGTLRGEGIEGTWGGGGEGKRCASFQMQKWEKKSTLPSFFALFFLFYGFFFFNSAGKEDNDSMVVIFFFHFFVDVSNFFFLVFCYEQGDNNKLVNIT